MRTKICILVMLLVLITRDVWACAVCFGDPNAAMTKGVLGAVLFLVLVITSVLGGFACFFINLRKRVNKFKLSGAI